MVLRASRRGSMDVACLSDIDMFRLSQQGIWEPITEQNVPNLKHVPQADVKVLDPVANTATNTMPIITMWIDCSSGVSHSGGP